MKFLFLLKNNFFIISILLYGCTTYSVTVVHSEGVASDVVDESQVQTPTTTTSANATIPSSLID